MTNDTVFTEWQMGESQLLTDPRPHFAAEPVVELSGCRVLVLGCGSVGGLAAWTLASAGVGSLTLIDRDQLERGNLRRHVCGADAVGQAKAAALARLLGDHFPTTLPEPLDLDVLERPDDLREQIGAADALLVAVDEEGPKHLADAMARELGKPAIYAGVYGGGWAGEVILSDAEARTPCYACAARVLGRIGIPLFPHASGSDYALPATGVPASDWARADLVSLMPVAALAASVLVARLLASRGHRRPLAELTQQGVSAWRFPLRAVPGWGGPWSLLPCPVAAFAQCRVCQPKDRHSSA